MAATGERREVPPLPYDGVGTVTVGTLIWFVAFVVTLVFHSRLEHQGRLWWVAATAIGAGLGVLGTWYCRRRAAAIRRGDPHAPVPVATSEPG